MTRGHSVHPEPATSFANDSGLHLTIAVISSEVERSRGISLKFHFNKLLQKIIILSKVRPGSAELERGEGKTEQHNGVYLKINGVSSGGGACLPRQNEVRRVRLGRNKEICQNYNF
jgi:hypothetical protein